MSLLPRRIRPEMALYVPEKYPYEQRDVSIRGANHL